MQVIQVRKQALIKLAGALFILLLIFAIGHHAGKSGGKKHHKSMKKHHGGSGDGEDTVKNVHARSKRNVVDLYEDGSDVSLT